MAHPTLTLTGYSTALFSTWFFVEELGLLFDAGDGITASLLQKSRKIKHAFISHADRDHLTGLFQFNQLNARAGFPIIYYPEDSGSFPAIQAFTEKFDPHVRGTIWKPIKAQEDHFIKKNIFVRSIRNNHIQAAANRTKSLSFSVFQTKQKLKTAYQHLSGQEIKKIAEQKGRAAISEEVIENIISYSGDTPVEDFERWNNTKILIHEATFLGKEANLNTHAHKHSTLEEVLEMVAASSIEQLVLSHFSSRYSPVEIDKAIIGLCKTYQITIPVYRILPGMVMRDILRQPPVNA